MSSKEIVLLRRAFDDMLSMAPPYSMDNSNEQLWILFLEVIHRWKAWNEQNL